MRKDARFESGPPKHLFDVATPLNTFGDGGRVVDISPDGQNFVGIQGWADDTPRETPSKINVVLGWIADLQPRQGRSY